MDVRTEPKPIGFKISEIDPSLLCHGRYGTNDMVRIWGPENTYQYSLTSQAQASATLSEFYPDIVSPEHATEILNKAKLKSNENPEGIDPQVIRTLEDETGHDVVAITRSLEKNLTDGAKPHPGKARTSADTTETAKALQLKESTEVIVDSLENLRDILIEKSMEWINDPSIDQTHLYDALPTYAGRAFVYYAETLQSGLELLAYFYKHSIKGKWGDATGNHHSAVDLGVDGMMLQEEYCKKFGIGFMTAAAQTPAREFIADLIFGLTRSAETMGNIGQYMAFGFGDDANIFIDKTPKKRKGSSAMPHKDVKGGNRTIEEQTESYQNYMRGVMMTMMSACKVRYARDLSGSASDRIDLDDAFKWGDFVIRRLASAIYYLDLNRDRTTERVLRTNGLVTSPRVLTHLTDYRKTSDPLARSYADEILGRSATQAYNEKRPFADVLLENSEIVSRLSPEKLRELTNPLTYTGQSREIIEKVNTLYHGKKILIN